MPLVMDTARMTSANKVGATKRQSWVRTNERIRNTLPKQPSNRNGKGVLSRKMTGKKHHQPCRLHSPRKYDRSPALFWPANAFNPTSPFPAGYGVSRIAT